MKPLTTNAAAYNPGDAPTDPAQLARWWREESAKLKAAIDAVAEGFAPVVYAYPAKPRAGMLRNFDGTIIDPGSGAGIYRFDGVNWQFLG